MSCGIGFVQWLSENNYLPATGRVLDLGGSDLLGATANELRNLLSTHGTSLSGLALDAACAEMAGRSALDPPSASAPLTLADMFATTGVTYRTYDPARWLPWTDRDTADIVLNFGATAGVWDQAATFADIHAGCKVGGWMFHQLPATGHLGYGYYCYQPPFFAALADANRYELTALWYSGPLSADSVLSLAERWPGVGDPASLCNDVEGFRTHPVPDSVVNVLFRKIRPEPFVRPMAGPPKPSLLARAARSAYRKLLGR